jgi:hypothetical protein
MTGPVTLTCTRADLAWALKAVLPHVSRDRGLYPELEAVFFDAAGDGTLCVVATDRYTLGCATVPCLRDPGAPATALIGAGDVRELAARLARQERGDKRGAARLEIYGDGDVFADWGVRYQSLTWPLTWPVLAGERREFIDWRKLLGRFMHAPSALPRRVDGFAGPLLARFAAAGLSGALTVMPVRTSADGPRAAAVVLGDRFAGAIAACRVTSTDYDPVEALEEWRARVPAVSP